MAEFSPVCFPFGADQGESAAMSINAMAGVKNGRRYEKFHELYDGTIIVGTEDAIKDEMAEVWQRVKGPEG
ncbi:MAG: hypothetical protein TREMPRED_000077, partial [Tremellales sp. Tagirdzhanova-0007]